MISIKGKDILKASGGNLWAGDAELTINGFSIDSRQIVRGEFFVPLAGKKNDGHSFIQRALEKGAAGTFFSPAFFQPDIVTRPGKILIQVDDPLKALQDVARYYRGRFPIEMIAVTGSTGKTTTKDFVHAVVSKRWNTLKSEGNLNNHIGLPLSLLKLTPGHRAAVLEMGMRAPGEISFLSYLAQPTMAIVTNIGESHLELLGTKERIARAKGELLYWLQKGHTALVNGDDELCSEMVKHTSARVLFFGFSNRCHFQAKEPVTIGPAGTSFLARTPEGRETDFFIPLPGRHHVYNALAAIAAGYLVNISLPEIKDALQQAPITRMRTEIIYSRSGVMIISDVYNASPDSMMAAIEVLAELSYKKVSGLPIAVLGDMLELGPSAPLFHEQIGREFAARKVERMILYGFFKEDYRKGAIAGGLAPERIYCCESLQNIQGILRQHLTPGSVVLVKGSRALMLEKIVGFLEEL